MNIILSSKRLHLSEIEDTDVQFVFDLFTDPDCLRFIGDRGISHLSDAKVYLQEKLIDSYHTHGFGLYKVTLKTSPIVMGICGLVKRDETNPPDIGFGFLPQFRNGGYCTEASRAVLQWSQEQKISSKILAYTNPDNVASIRVLEKIGLVKQTVSTLPGQKQESLILAIQYD